MDPAFQATYPNAKKEKWTLSTLLQKPTKIN